MPIGKLMARSPNPRIALVKCKATPCELLRASLIFHLLDEHKLAVQTSSRSEHLRNLIEQRFWIQDRSYYAMALDGEKHPLQVDSSNPGHLLFCAAISGERAREVSERLLAGASFPAGAFGLSPAPKRTSIP
jgi:glycogen debranching enzyme